MWDSSIKASVWRLTVVEKANGVRSEEERNGEQCSGQ